jgi:CarD family transcriptional regulator
MKVTVGDKVVYPAQGLCLIGPIVNKIVDERSVRFYQLILLNDEGGDLFVPVDKVQVIGIRLPLKKSEIPKLLDHLKRPVTPADTWKQRAANNRKLLASGSAFDLAEVVESLTELREKRSLSFGESKLLEKAKMLLISEICEVMRSTKEEAEQQIDEALKARKAEGQQKP